MKKLLSILLLAATIVACQNTSKNLGETFTPQQPMTIDAVAAQLAQQPELKNIQIEGVVEKSCMSIGCWFSIKDEKGNAIVLDIADEQFKVPTNSPGKTVIVLADAKQDSTSEQKIAISVKGMMFK
ncbi:MAG TPA: DUF4920 domain-containing protein [Chitinophagales bacterium]|jgi:hypothetical protein|nr:DUF4920 domain-containing protein [Chitinophagales bacterium]HPA35261.1 DUF4920 domain-containing protein [Chitinophagales bacterium]HPW86269.1 DUF4920 domain-containing protein [Chitinophagales bacterium]HQD11341.1 DUF4920 domain-containing protein [Chitinophagales bacterium]HQO31839.1 DUF4920 domain-containing protein [Chitinophagales bacterium]